MCLKSSYLAVKCSVLFFLPTLMAMEVGTVELSVANDWQNVEILGEYTEPIVVTGAITRNDTDSIVAQVRNVTPASFDIRIVDWGTAGLHTGTETVTFLVAESGRQSVGGLIIEAGKKTNYTNLSEDEKK